MLRVPAAAGGRGVITESAITNNMADVGGGDHERPG